MPRRRREARAISGSFVVEAAAESESTNLFVIDSHYIIRKISIRAKTGHPVTCTINIAIPGLQTQGGEEFEMPLKSGTIRGGVSKQGSRGALVWEGEISLIGFPNIEGRRPSIKLFFHNNYSSAGVGLEWSILYEELL